MNPLCSSLENETLMESVDVHVAAIDALHGKDQMQVFQWFLQLGELLEGTALPPAVRDRVVQALLTRHCIYSSPPWRQVTLRGNPEECNYELFHAFKEHGRIHLQTIALYERLLELPVRMCDAGTQQVKYDVYMILQ